jgi:hypothetical protein
MVYLDPNYADSALRESCVRRDQPDKWITNKNFDRYSRQSMDARLAKSSEPFKPEIKI